MVVERSCRIPIADLQTIRFTCQKCNRITETTIEDAADLSMQGMCKHCSDRFFEMRGQNPFAELASALRRFADLNGKVSVEFVISDSDRETT